jgi:hypothetical protein
MGLDELCRLAAQEMLKVALLAERRAYLDAHNDQLDATGKHLVVGNGYARERQVTTGAGMVEVKAPRVDDRREGERYCSVILPAYMRKSPKVTEVLPLLYLRGLSTGDFAPALAEFFGSGAGLSASTVQRLTESWQAEHGDWAARDLSGTDYVYWWADGVHFNVRLEEDRLCCLVVGARPDGTKQLVALADGYRESSELGRRPALAPGPGAWPPLCWPWVTGRSAFGRHCGTFSPPPKSKGVGYTKLPTAWTHYQNAFNQRLNQLYKPSTTPRPGPPPLRQPRTTQTPSPSSPRRRPR